MYKINSFKMKLLSILIISFSLIKSKPHIKRIQPGSKTVIAYMSARNDLNIFANRNISEMQLVGSNNLLKIVAQLDTFNKNKKSVTKRLLIEKDKPVQIGPDLSLDSGDPENLVNFFAWAVDRYPAEKYVLILWNHGTGPLDPNIPKAINPYQLFKYHPEKKIIELNRSVGFLDYVNQINDLTVKTKGICFDDTTGNYLTNKKLTYALKKIHSNVLNNQKFALCCDACLMANIEVIYPIKDYIESFTGSQEVVLGTGYNYSFLLRPLALHSYDINDFPKHAVSCFNKTYSKITNDFTQSSVDPKQTEKAIENIADLVNTLSWGLKNQKNNKIKDFIKISRHKYYCTHFDEPSYIDIGHFYKNLKTNIKMCELNNPTNTNSFKNKLLAILDEMLNQKGILNKLIIANTSGKNLQNATGISIYFPERHIHNSYHPSEFTLRTGWIDFLKLYFNTNRQA